MKLVLNPNVKIKKVIRLTESQFKKLVKVMAESSPVLDPQGDVDNNQPLEYSPGLGTDPDQLESDDEMWNNLISGEEPEDHMSSEEKYEQYVRDHQTARNREPLKRDDREYFEPEGTMPVPLPSDSPDWERPEFDEFAAHTEKQLGYGKEPEVDDIDHPGFNRTPWKTTK